MAAIERTLPLLPVSLKGMKNHCHTTGDRESIHATEVNRKSIFYFVSKFLFNLSGKTKIMDWIKWESLGRLIILSNIPSLVEYWPFLILNHLKCDFGLSQEKQRSASFTWRRQWSPVVLHLVLILGLFLQEVPREHSEKALQRCLAKVSWITPWQT